MMSTILGPCTSTQHSFIASITLKHIPRDVLVGTQLAAAA